MKELSSNRTNKVCLITGATSGIGASVSDSFARSGYQLLLTGSNKTKLQQLQANIKISAGTIAAIITADLTKEPDIQGLIETINQIGRIDVIVHCASLWHSKDKAYYGIDYEQYAQDVIGDTMSITLNSFMNITHGLIPLMKEKQSGSIIAITGTFENGASGWLPYYTAKQALEAYCKGLSQELAKDMIRVNCISPSDTKTKSYERFFPEYAQDALDPEYISAFALFLASEEAKYITGATTVMKKY